MDHGLILSPSLQCLCGVRQLGGKEQAKMGSENAGAVGAPTGEIPRVSNSCKKSHLGLASFNNLTRLQQKESCIESLNRACCCASTKKEDASQREIIRKYLHPWASNCPPKSTDISTLTMPPTQLPANGNPL
jgi:hypothetical protein